MYDMSMSLAKSENNQIEMDQRRSWLRMGIGHSSYTAFRRRRGSDDQVGITVQKSFGD